MVKGCYTTSCRVSEVSRGLREIHAKLRQSVAVETLSPKSAGSPINFIVVVFRRPLLTCKWTVGQSAEPSIRRTFNVKVAERLVGVLKATAPLSEESWL